MTQLLIGVYPNVARKTKMTKLSALQVWMRIASVDEQEKLAKSAETSRQNLYHMAAGNRAASSKMAIRLEKGAAELRKTNKNLPVLLRSDLNETCKGCDFARRCIGAERITISDFDYVLDDSQRTG